MSKNKNPFLFLIGVLILLSSTPYVLFAQAVTGDPRPDSNDLYDRGTPTTFVPLANYSGSTQLSEILKKDNLAPSTSNGLAAYINSIFKIVLSLGAILAVLRIAYAGYQYMGSEMWSNKSKAKEDLSNALVGLLLLFSVYLILWQINPNLLNLNVSLKGAQSPQTQSGANGCLTDACLGNSVPTQGTLNQANPNNTSGIQGKQGSPSGITQASPSNTQILSVLNSVSSGSYCFAIIQSGAEKYLCTTGGKEECIAMSRADQETTNMQGFSNCAQQF